MNTRGVIGARIVAVRQIRCRTNGGAAHHIEQIELDNGHILTFSVHETEGDYVISGRNHPPERPVPADR